MGTCEGAHSEDQRLISPDSHGHYIVTQLGCCDGQPNNQGVTAFQQL